MHGDASSEAKRLAWNALKRAVSHGMLPPARTLRCTDCGRSAAHYDHHLGYAVEHQLDVQPVCARCHLHRGIARGERTPGRVPLGVTSCTICGRVSARYVQGRCLRCYYYRHRHGQEWTPDVRRGH